MDLFNILRQVRLGPFAVFDFAAAYLGIFVLSPILTKLFAKVGLYFSRIDWLWLTLPIGILFHLVLRLNTPLVNMVLDTGGNYAVKALLVFMIFMGLKNCRNPQNINTLKQF